MFFLLQILYFFVLFFLTDLCMCPVLMHGILGQFLRSGGRRSNGQVMFLVFYFNLHLDIAKNVSDIADLFCFRNILHTTADSNVSLSFKFCKNNSHYRQNTTFLNTNSFHVKIYHKSTEKNDKVTQHLALRASSNVFKLLESMFIYK